MTPSVTDSMSQLDLPNVKPCGTSGSPGEKSGRAKEASWVTGIMRQACGLR